MLRDNGYRSKGPGSIPGATRSYVVGGVHSFLLNTIEELLERKGAAPVYKTEINAVGIGYAMWHLYPQKLALTLSTISRSSVDIVRSRTRATGVFIANIILPEPIDFEL
jgi:hypothetical protein